MGNPFGNLTTQGLEENEDRLGGGYQAKETDIYTGEIKAFYAGKSAAGAHNVTVILTGGDFGSQEYRETVYITSKTGSNSYEVKDGTGKPTGKKQALPGFTVIDDMCLCTVGKSLSEIGFEEKVMNVYDYEAKKELPKSVDMATELLGKQVSVAVNKTIENKTEKNANGDYVPKADGSTREVNNITKVFNTSSKMTVAEAKGGATEGAFWNAWLDKNKGKTIDKTEKVGGTAGRPGGNGGAPQSGQTGNTPPRSSLFGGNS